MSVLPHKHFLSLPKGVSKSGQRPSMWARLGFVLIGVVIVFVVANMGIAAATEGVILPGVSVAGKDLSFKTRAQAKQELEGLNTQRNFTIQVGDKTFTATSEDLGASYDINATVNLAYDIGHTSPLPLVSLAEVNTGGQLGYSYHVDTQKLKDFTSKIVSSVGNDPVNATLKITDGNIEVVPDQDGLRIDEKALSTLLNNSIADGKDQNLKLDPVSIKAPIQAKDIGGVQKQADDLLNRNVVLNYEGKQFVPNRADKGHWLEFDAEKQPDGTEKLVIHTSREQIKGYLQSVANQVDIAPINKKITIVNGSETVDREGHEGTAINQDPAADQITTAFNSNQDTNVTLTSRPVAFSTERKRIGNCSSQDSGKAIEVNLSSQSLLACQDGQVVFSTPITSGAAGAGFPTVQGTFAIYAKERSRYLNGAQYGYSYNVYVDYWMPFYSGFGLHDADWRSSFGGQDYYYGGSHGCVNMPKSSAAFLYGWADVGTPVWIHS